MAKLLVCLLSIAVLAGCQSRREPLYYYGEYNIAVFSYFKGDDTTLEEQIQVLEQAVQLAAANGKQIAPGLHAHLGMLYFEIGAPSQGIEQLNIERNLFPESEKYVQFLLRNYGES